MDHDPTPGFYTHSRVRALGAVGDLHHLARNHHFSPARVDDFILAGEIGMELNVGGNQASFARIWVDTHDHADLEALLTDGPARFQDRELIRNLDFEPVHAEPIGACDSSEYADDSGAADATFIVVAKARECAARMVAGLGCGPR